MRLVSLHSRGLRIRASRFQQDGTASGLIERLKDRIPPTEAQLGFIEDRAEGAGLDEMKSCNLVGEKSFDTLTGGLGGMASELIEGLRTRVGSSWTGLGPSEGQRVRRDLKRLPERGSTAMGVLGG